MLILAYPSRIDYFLPLAEDVGTFVGPWWEESDAHAQPSVPRMTVVETVGMGGLGLQRGGYSILPDPVRGEYLHILSPSGQAFLLQSALLLPDPNPSTSPNPNPSTKIPCALCLPLYSPGSGNSSAVTSKPSLVSSAVSSFCVLADPLMGHVAVFRTERGAVDAVGVQHTVYALHSKLREGCRPLDHDEDRVQFLPDQDLAEAVPLPGDLQRKIDESCDTEMGDPKINVLLMEATAYLERSAIAPLTDYAHRIVMLLGSLKDKHQRQAADMAKITCALSEQQTRQAELAARMSGCFARLKTLKVRGGGRVRRLG